jgi:hypothetical protein
MLCSRGCDRFRPLEHGLLVLSVQQSILDIDYSLILTRKWADKTLLFVIGIFW